MDKKKVIVYLLLIFLLALSVRIVKVWTKPIICRDSTLYISIANIWANFEASGGYKAHVSRDTFSTIPPVYIFCLSLGRKYSKVNPEMMGNIIGIVLGGLLVVAVFCIAQSLFSSYELALVAAFLAAIHPYLIRMSSLILRGAVYLPFLAFALAFAVSAIKNRSYLKWGIYSLFLAIASMTRFEGIFCLLVFFFWFFYELIFSELKICARIRYVVISFLIVMSIFFGNTYIVRWSLRNTESTWGNTDFFSLKYTGKF